MKGMKKMTLSNTSIGENCSVEKIELKDNVKRRLEILGMTKNATIEVLNKKKSGAMIVKVRGTRFAIGKKFADGIYVGGEGE